MSAIQIMPAENNAVTPLELMQDAITKGASVELMQQLLDLYKSARDFQAEKAFHAAMAKAKAEIPVIVKTNSAFGRYVYEDIGDIADVVVPILSKYDLYYRWETAPGTSPGITIVTCVIAHKDGHSIRNSLPAVADTTRNSNMNANQAVGSSITYIQRYTLKAALGLAAAKDDDAQAAGKQDEDKRQDRGPWSPERRAAFEASKAAAAEKQRVFKPTPQQYDEMVKRENEDFRKQREANADEANNTSSGDDYALRWQEVMASAASADELTMQWNSERVLRGKVDWHDPEQPARLKEMVTRRIEELKAAQDDTR